MKKFLVISAIALATFSAFCAGTKKFGKMKDSDWVVTNAWQAMQHRVKPDSEWATNHFGSAEFSNAVGKVLREIEIPGAGGGCDTNTVDALANSAVVTNALTVATTNRVASLESSKANRPALPVTAGNFASLDPDGNLLDSGYNEAYFIPRDSNDRYNISFPSGESVYFGGLSHLAGWEPDRGFYAKIGGMMLNGWGDYKIGFNWPQTLPEYLASGDWNTASDPFVKKSGISATNQTFSNAVLAVGLNIDTNSVAVLNEIAATFGGFPLGAGETATTVGGLLAALAAAVAWLKKNKVGSFGSVGGATATVENGVAKLDDFFTESNSLLNGRLAYSRNATGLKDRAFNTLSFDGTEYNLSTALEAVMPTASGHPRDLLIVATATAATTISFTAGTIKGDKPTIDGAGTWLITLTEYASGVWYCRQIKMEDAA